MIRRALISCLRRFIRRDDGVALVEFGLFLPVFLLAFFVVVEFGRTFFSYQGALAGVRDATRYAARTLDHTACIGHLDGENPDLPVIATAASPDATYRIVERNLLNEVDLLPTNVRIVQTVTLTRCVVQADAFREAEVPIARVVATIEIVLPLGEILEFNGRPLINNITTNVSDESRIFGI